MRQVFHHARIHTMDEAFPTASYMVVENGFIRETGTELNSSFYTASELVDMEGCTILPGFNDSHLHLLSYAKNLEVVDLKNTRSIPELLSLLHEQLVKNGGPGWISGYGWDDTLLAEKIFPSRYDLDKVSTHIPISIRRVCGHITVVNSKVVEMLDLANTPDPPGGRIERTADGIPTGVLKEAAGALVSKKMSPFSRSESKVLLKKAVEKVNGYGLTSLQPLDMSRYNIHWSDVWSMYRELEEEGSLSARVYLQANAYFPEDVRELAAAGFRTGQGSLVVKQGAVKMFMDGSLGGDTASLLEPYSHNPSSTGLTVHDDAEIEEMIFWANKASLQVAIHAIGDRAALSSLRACEGAQNRCPRADARHRLVHCQVVNEEILQLFSKLQVIADIQPRFLSSDVKWIEKKLGPSRSRHAYAWKSFLDNKIRAAGGSDSPYDDINPMEGIYSAVTRKDMNGAPGAGWNPEQKLTVTQAIRLFTADPAYASFEENVKGTLSPGKLADFIVLDKDPYRTVPDALKDIKVLETYLGGKRVYPSHGC